MRLLHYSLGHLVLAKVALIEREQRGTGDGGNVDHQAALDALAVGLAGVLDVHVEGAIGLLMLHIGVVDLGFANLRMRTKWLDFFDRLFGPGMMRMKLTKVAMRASRGRV